MKHYGRTYNELQVAALVKDREEMAVDLAVVRDTLQTLIKGYESGNIDSLDDVIATLVNLQDIED